VLKELLDTRARAALPRSAAALYNWQDKFIVAVARAGFAPR